MMTWLYDIRVHYETTEIYTSAVMAGRHSLVAVLEGLEIYLRIKQFYFYSSFRPRTWTFLPYSQESLVSEGCNKASRKQIRMYSVCSCSRYHWLQLCVKYHKKEQFHNADPLCDVEWNVFEEWHQNKFVMTCCLNIFKSYVKVCDTVLFTVKQN